MLKKKILWKYSKKVLIFLFIYIGIIFYLSSLQDIAKGVLYFKYQDKVFHLIEYTILSILVLISFRKYRYFKLKIFIFVVLFALSDEVHQIFVDTRVFDKYDLLMDIIPVSIMMFFRYPIKVKNVTVEGRYDTKIYEMIRSITSINCFLTEENNFKIIITKNEIRFGYENVIFKKIQIKDNLLEIKRQIFNELKNILQKDISDWGVVYQTRPLKKLEYLDGSKVEKRNKLRKDYLIKDKKVDLMMNLFDIKNKVKNKFEQDDIGIYINIPFCPSKCSYCSFTSYSLDIFGKYYKRFFNNLIKELKYRLKNYNKKNIKLVYIGGGTPLTLKKKDLKKLLDTIYKFVDKDKLLEFTFEGGRPELFTKEKIELLAEYNISRVAVNPQTLNNKILERVNRKHNVKDFYKAFNKIQKYDFDIINSDLILGLPQTNFNINKKTINNILKLENINNITLHVLAPKRGSKMYKEGYNYDKNVKKSFNYMVKRMKDKGFKPYYLYKQRHIIDNMENIGFAKNNKISLYNIAMISELIDIYGFGVGASSKYVVNKDVNTERNPKDLVKYMRKVEKL